MPATLATMAANVASSARRLSSFGFGAASSAAGATFFDQGCAGESEGGDWGELAEFAVGGAGSLGAACATDLELARVVFFLSALAALAASSVSLKMTFFILLHWLHHWLCE